MKVAGLEAYQHDPDQLDFDQGSLISNQGATGQILRGFPNANAKSQRFSYAISPKSHPAPVVALHRSFESQIAARYAAFWHAVPQIALASLL